MENIAAVDVGSNAIRMIVGRLNSDNKLDVLDNIRVPVRLGQDVFTSGLLSEQTIQMAVGAFFHFRKTAQVFDVARVRTVATSAMREAANGDILIDRIASQTGFTVETISGDEEARLVHIAVTHAVDLGSKRAVIIDIGGGSVEVIIADRKNVIFSESYEMGAVRLLRKLGANGREQQSFKQLVREYADKALRQIESEIGDEKIDVCLGTGGNVEEMGRLRKKLFKRATDSVITLGEIEALIDKLSSLDYEERIKRLSLRPDRADVIVPAAVVLHTLVRDVGLDEVQIPGVGLKDGVLLELARQAEEPRLPRREQVWISSLRMGQKYQFDQDHSQLVARLAARVFSQTLSLHNLQERELLLLEAACLLHDVGHFINTIDHDKHGYYLLTHHRLVGLSPDEQKIIANIVRYHRKETPSSADDNFKSLSQKDRLIVTKLCAIMRLADALDTSHTGRITDVILEPQDGKWILKPIGTSELMLEKWSLQKRKVLFQDVFGVTLEIEG